MSLPGLLCKSPRWWEHRDLHVMQDCLRFLKRWRPKLAILENVPQIDSSGALKLITDNLEGAQFVVLAKSISLSIFHCANRTRCHSYPASSHLSGPPRSAPKRKKNAPKIQISPPKRQTHSGVLKQD